MLENLEGKGVLIHHWDTDGICSARLLLKKFTDKTIDNKTPIIGNYFLTEVELNNYSNYDFVIVADMALPKENIHILAQKANIMIFDHHLQEEIKEVEHYNPIIKGENPDKYPSASWIINTYLSNNINLYALLGIVGDHERRIKNNKLFNRLISDFCQKHNLEFSDLLKMAYLLDSNYKLGNKKAVEIAPRLLLNYNDATDILKNSQWNKNLRILSEEIDKQLDRFEDETKGIILKKIDTPFNIISTITRKVAWQNKKNTLVINTGFFKDKDQVYVRSNKSLEPLIKRAKSLGYNAGGKKEVMGAIVPKDKTDCFVDDIVDYLSSETKGRGDI